MLRTRLQAGCDKQALTHHRKDGGNNRLTGKLGITHDTIVASSAIARNDSSGDRMQPDLVTPPELAIYHQGTVVA